MKKMILGLAAVFALASGTPAFAEDAPAGDTATKPVKTKGVKKGKKVVKKPAEPKAQETK